MLQAFRYGAIDYLLKPFNELELMEALQRVINAQPLLREQIDITLHSVRKKKMQDRIALRCQEFVKIVKKMAEDGRVAIRHVRRDAMEQLKKHGHDSGTTEDEVKHAEKELQKLTDDYIGKIDGQLAHKEKEIMTV